MTLAASPIVTLEPIVADLRSIYDRQGTQARFAAYLQLMLHTRKTPLPLEDFSPMGQRQAGFLDRLVALKVESHLQQRLANGLADKIRPRLPCPTRAMLVVLDEPRNGWTQRHLTDAKYRFGELYQFTPKTQTRSFVWVPVYLWTTNQILESVDPSLELVERELLAALERCAHKATFKTPHTLRDMLTQEAASLGPTPCAPTPRSQDLKTLRPLLDTTHFPTLFSAIYGDKAATCVGYPPLGLAVPLLDNPHEYERLLVNPKSR